MAREHRRRLLDFFVRRVRSAQDAEDLCQDVLEDLLRARSDTVLNPLAFALSIAADTVADYFRKKRLPLVAIDERAPDQAAHMQEDTISAVEFGEQVERALQSLPANKQRDVYIQRLLHGTPFSQIAAELSISVAVARNYYSTVNHQVWEFIRGQGEPK